MRTLPIILLLLISLSAWSQLPDRLIFKDGYNWPVKVSKIEGDSLFFVRYDDKVESTELGNLKEYSFQGKWYRLEDKEWKAFDTNKHDDKVSIFNIPSEFVYSRFSLSTNLLLPFVDVSFDDASNYSSDSYYGYGDHVWPTYIPHTNRSFSIEPEFRFFDRFALKFPVMINLDWSNPTSIYKIPTGGYSGSNFRSVFYQANTYDVDTSDIQSIYSSYDYYYENLRGHAKKVLFQIGIKPKWLLFGPKKIAPYVGVGLYTGMIEQYQIDFYFDYRYELADSWPDDRYKALLIREEGFYHSSPQLFMRYDINMGLEFNLTSNLNFGLEFAYISKFLLEKEVKDRIFARYNNDPYTLIGERSYSFRSPGPRDPGYAVGRLYLIYRFNNRKEN